MDSTYELAVIIDSSNEKPECQWAKLSEFAELLAWDPTRGSSEEPPKVGKIQTPR